MNENTINGEKTLRGGQAGALGRIDQYEIVRELGEGGFGAVYLARDTVAGVEVAIKGLPPEVKHNRAEMENVKANFALVSRLHHPYIAAALHLHLAKTATYANTQVRDRLRVLPGDAMLVMEYAPGVTLDRWRKQFPGGVVPFEQAGAIAWQVAQALDFAHENRVLHRDVKPANVMIETLPDGSVTARLLDFGLAAEIRSSMGRVSREIRDTSGTRPYMAPEQWSGRRQTAATDQYALAAMLYEMITGEVPFASVFDTGDPVVMMTVVTTRPVEIPAECPRRRSLVRALSKDGAERYPSCMDFITDFAKSERLDDAPTSAASDRSSPAKAHRTHDVRRLVLTAVCALVVVAGTVAFLAARRNRLELAELSARISERRQAFVTEYAKVDAFRSYVLQRKTRSACVSRLDALYEEQKSIVMSKETAVARERLQRMDEIVAQLRAGLATLERDEQLRQEEEAKAKKAREEEAKKAREEEAKKAREEAAKKAREEAAKKAREEAAKAKAGVLPERTSADGNGGVRIRPTSKTSSGGAVTVKPPEPVKTEARRPDMREETKTAKRCAQNADWEGCYKHLVHADTNDCEIMYLYGVCLSSMHPDKQAGVAKNDRRAYNWFQRGTDLGDAPCQQNLGEACRRGVGTKKDTERALHLIKKAADQGNPEAVCSLAQMLEAGEGIAKDAEKAADLYALAAQKRVAYAQDWILNHHDADRYKKMVAKRTKTKPAAPTPSSTRPRPRPSGFSRSPRAYDGDWSSSGPSIGGGGSNTAVWSSVLGGVLTGLAIGLSAIH